MSEEPLHVCVAEALGWRAVEARSYYESDEGVFHHYGVSPDMWERLCRRDPLMLPHVGRIEVPRYDTDWSATGPLIERFGISLSFAPCNKHVGCEDLRWDADARDEQGDSIAVEAGPTALIAVCDLIVRLSEAGKLEAR